MSARKLSDEEKEKRLERAENAARRQVDAALAACKFTKDAVGSYHVKDIGEARRWIKAAQGHFTEALGIFDTIDEDLS